jgi:hypothetical protein
MTFAFKNAGAKTRVNTICGLHGNREHTVTTKIKVFKTSLLFKGNPKAPLSRIKKPSLLRGNLTSLDSITRLLRLKLVLDTYNYDDILIAFNSGTSTVYNGYEDVEYMRGINAAVGLSSFSSDGFQLSQNYLPLPKQTPLIIRLAAEAEFSGQYTFERTQCDSLPPIYQVWLVDKYKKDSLDLRNNPAYTFTVDKRDTNSFGKNRFYVVVRQNPALGVHLLDFTAAKTSTGAQISWRTENHQDYTKFAVERSADNGFTFHELTNLRSSLQGSYSYLDISPPDVPDQYRLKIEDLNGTISYSKVVTLLYGNVNKSAGSNISVYPNPAGNTINLDINLAAAQTSSTPAISQTGGTQSYSIKIMSITGSVVKKATSSQATWQDNVGDLKPGTYFIQVVNNSNNSIVGKRAFIKL